MEIRPYPDGFGTVRVALEGELDLATADECQERLVGLMSIAGTREVILDLAGLTFVDCAGLRAFVVARSAGVHAGVHVRIEQPQAIVGCVLRTTGLPEVSEWVDRTPIRPRRPLGDADAQV